MLAFRLLLCVAVMVVGASLMPLRPNWAQQAANAQPDEKMTALLKARLALAEKGYETVAKSFGLVRNVGGGLKGGLQILVTKPDEVYQWSVRWLHAERDLNPKKAAMIAAHENHLKRMKQLETKLKQLAPGLAGTQEMDAEWYRLEAELWLAKAKQ